MKRAGPGTLADRFTKPNSTHSPALCSTKIGQCTVPISPGGDAEKTKCILGPCGKFINFCPDQKFSLPPPFLQSLYNLFITSFICFLCRQVAYLCLCQDRWLS